MNSLKIRNTISMAAALAATLALVAGCSSTKNEQAENGTYQDQSVAMNSANNGRAAQTFTNDLAVGAPGTTYESQSGVVTSGTTATSASITQLSQLNTSANANVMPGQKVEISNVKVDKVISDKLFTVRADDGTTIYVRTMQATSGLSSGQIVNLEGTVRKVPSDTSTLGWDQDSAQALQGQQFFIHVKSVTPTSQ